MFLHLAGLTVSSYITHDDVLRHLSHEADCRRLIITIVMFQHGMLLSCPGSAEHIFRTNCERRAPKRNRHLSQHATIDLQSLYRLIKVVYRLRLQAFHKFGLFMENSILGCIIFGA